MSSNRHIVNPLLLVLASLTPIYYYGANGRFKHALLIKVKRTMKIKRSGILTGTAGVYFVASQLAAKGFHAAPTFGNAPNVDILVGLPDGAATLSLQVKTTMHATRLKGRGQERHWDHYEWDLGTKYF